MGRELRHSQLGCMVGAHIPWAEVHILLLVEVHTLLVAEAHIPFEVAGGSLKVVDHNLLVEVGMRRFLGSKNWEFH